MTYGFKQVRIPGGDTAERVAGADPGDGAFVAVEATIMAHLEEERTVAEPVASFDAFGAADAKLFVNRVFEVGVLDERTFDGGGRAEAILGTGIEIIWFGLEITCAKLAIAADGISVHAFDGRLFEHTMGGAVATANTFLGINLPNRALA